jgi:alanine racemase
LRATGPSLRPLWAEIDLAAVAHNYRALRRALKPGIQVIASLKGNAYGCGVREVGRLLAAEGVDGHAVGNIDDAAALREAGIDGPILLYPNCLPDAAAAVLDQRLAITLNAVEEADAWAKALRQPVDAWIKLDMGAFRAGVLPQQAVALARKIAGERCFRLRGIYGHLHLPDPVGLAEYARWQAQNFETALRAIAVAGIAPPLRMAAGTAAVLQYPELDFDAVDPGRLLYGVGFAGTRRDLGLRPALKALRTRIVQCKHLGAADTGGFPTPFPWRAGMVIGVLPLGWGDGYPRPVPPGAVALVRGRRAPLLGPTHFEHMRIDLTDVPDAAYGDEVTLVGRQGDDELSPEEIARAWGIGLLELYGGLRGHVGRIYVT